MRKLILFVGLQIIWTAGFSQSLPSYPGDIHIQRTNLVVRWKVPKYPWPKIVGIYHIVPTKFSPTVISNLMALGSFTEKDKRDYGDVIIFGKPYSTPNLRISFIEGEIDYVGDKPHYSITNLAKDVPEMGQLFQLTTNFLPKLGISLSEIAKQRNGKPKINFYEPLSGYPIVGSGPEGGFLTNIEQRVVSFSRDLDGGRFFYNGGHCEIDFGEHNKILKIELSWPSLECDKRYSAATPKKIVQWIHEGKAIQMHMMTSNGSETMINWSTVKGLTITNAVVYYWADSFAAREFAHQPLLPNTVYPDADISGTVDTGESNVYVEIVCPIIDETKPLKAKP